MPPRTVAKEQWICPEIMVKLNDIGDSNGCRNNFRVCAYRFVVSLNSVGNSQPATPRLPNEFKETTNGVRTVR